ncbi:MAG: phage tail protein [Bradyrhizobium sp.]|uniref:phage tail protein n=1 Tax=Bradyrhizobium sp. TaxID=376 RepID=UPI003D12C5AF
MALLLPQLPADVFNDVASSAAERLATVTAEGTPVPLVYGRQPLGASLLAYGLIDADLVLCCGWCLGEIEAIEALTINGQAPAETVTVTHYLGTPTQTVDATMAEAIAGYTDAMVALINGTLIGAAYSVLRIPQGATSGFPRVEALIRGRKLLDPRTDATTYSANPALAVMDFAKSAIYGPGLEVDSDSIEDAAEACDEVLTDGNPRRALNLVLDTPAPCAQWLEILRSYAGCFLVREGNILRLVPDRPVSTLTPVTDTEILEGSLRLSKRSMRNAPTVVRVIYTDQTGDTWRDMPAVAYTPGVKEGLIPWREEEVRLPGISQYSQAYREAVQRLNSANLTDLDAEFVMFDEALLYQVGDVLSITHRVGLSQKAMRILAISRYETGRWAISATEYTADVYSDAIITGPGADSPLPSPSSIGEVTEPGAFSGSEHLLRLADGTVMSRIYVSWESPVNLFYSHSEVRFRKGTDAYTYAPPGLSATYCAPVEDEATYEIQIRALNSFGVPSAWVTITHQVVGKTEPPPPPRQFLVSRDSDGGRRLTWLAPETVPADFKGYLIRSGAGLDLDWEAMLPVHEGVLTSSPYETNAIPSGDRTFAIVSMDTTGNISDPLYIEANLGDPRLAGALEVQESHSAGWPGTKTNCWIDPQSGWLLAVDTKDWADFNTDGDTWADWNQWARAPGTLVYTGEVVDAGLKTVFTPLLSAEGSGTVTAEVRTSDDNSTWSGWAVPSGQVNARYVQPRATVAPISSGFTALYTMTLILDANIISEDIEDLDTSTLTGDQRLGTGDIRLPITKTYGLIRKVDIALQNVGPGWSWEVIDKDTEDGPRIKIYNASNTLADATIDATVRGVA